MTGVSIKRLVSGIIFLLLATVGMQAQSGLCDPSTPFYVVDLSNQVNGSFVTPQDRRQGNCCSTVAPDRCVEFEVMLHPNAIGISFDIYSGAVPTGSMFYQINCGPPVPVGQAVCLSGAGPHAVTFCKPGNNPNAYIIRSIPPPYQAPDNEVRIGCTVELGTNGLIPSTISWTDITSGTGAYESFLSCVSGCSNTYFTPGPNAPAFVDYEVCGSIFDTVCNGNFSVCDTLRVFVYPELEVPDMDTIYYCITNGGVTLQGNAYGGFGAYEYYWYDSVGNVLGNGSSYFASTPGVYQLEIRDDLYPACPADIQNIHVLPDIPALVNAGPDTLICSAAPLVGLSGSYSNIDGAYWAGGNGSFLQVRDSVNNTYTPTTAELNALSVVLTLTSKTDTACPVVTDQKVIQFRTPPVLSVTEASDVSCFGAQDGFINITTSGGTAPYVYNWNEGSATEDVSGLDTGTYVLITVDDLGCADTIVQAIEQPTPIEASIVLTNVSCAGGSDGSIAITVSGGVPPYAYDWSQGGNNSAENSLGAGAYQITVSDVSGCTYLIDTVITEPQPLVAVVADLDNISCYRSNDGAIDIAVSGGVPPYTYNWSHGAALQDLMNLPAGSYTITVTDANGCSSSANATIIEPQPLQAILNTTNVSCYGGSNGAMQVQPGGGTAPYTFQWSNSAGSQSISNVQAGIYSFTMTDANGCALTDSRFIQEPSELVVAFLSNNVSCNGLSDGNIDLRVMGGVQPYTYQWSNGATVQDQLNIPADNYSVTVTDNNNCSQVLSFNITEPAAMLVSYVSSPASCNGGTNGAIDVTVSGGNGPYTYQWATGAVSQDLSGIPAGSYPLTITDAEGCSIDTVALVVEPNLIVLQATPVAHVSCYGGSNGAIDLTVSGGSGAYTYEWSNQATTQDISNLPAGTYHVTVNDVNNCRSIASATISQPTALAVTTSRMDITCAGAADGSLTAQVSGGTAPYTYQWSNGDNTATTSALDDGIYEVTVEDAHGCSIITVDTITQPDPLVLQEYISHVNCYGNSNGFIEVTPMGGTAPYAFEWNQGSTYPFLFNLSAGSYTVTVTDDRGCAVVATYQVLQPDSIRVTGTTSNVSCYNGSNGEIALTVSGGTPAYSYSWSHGATTSNVSGLSQGNYSVTVADMNGCSQTASFLIGQPDSLQVRPTVTNVSCNGGSNGAITIQVTGGTSPYTYQWAHGASTQNVAGLPAGSYTLTVNDANGCVTTVTRQVTEPLPLSVTLSSEDILCHGSANGSVVSSVVGGTAPYSYQWSHGALSADVFNLNPGSYRVTVTDARGCNIMAQTTIAEPQALTLVAAATDLSCYQANDGSIDVTVNGGTSPYTYSWLNGQTTSSLNTLAVGDYYLTVTDANGCNIYFDTTLTQPAELLLNAVSQDASCNGVPDGRVDLSVAGGVPGYTYSWSNGAVTQDLNNVPASVYTVTVTDGVGCSASMFVPVNEPSNLQIDAITTQQVSCNGGNNGAITLGITGFTPVSQISWSNGSNNQNLSQLQAGDYFVTVTDDNGCRIVDYTTVTEPDPLNIIPTIHDVSCFGGADGSVSIAVSGGTLPYQYNWSGGGSGTSNSNLPAGSYSLNVVDSAGCNTILNYVIEQPDELTVNAQVMNHVSCFGAADGIAEVLVAGGTPPYTIQWSNGYTTAQAAGLPAGWYDVSVTDANGCMNTSGIMITQPDTISIQPTATHVLCHGEAQGSIDIVVSGGTAPYAYQWSNADTTQNINGLTVGGYAVTVTDASGCTSVMNEVVQEPDSMIHQFTVGAVSCYNGNDGFAEITVSGGVAPYSYNWSNGATQTAITGQTVGTYTVTITDANGCVYVADTIIGQPDSMSLNVVTTDVSCKGLSDGAATVTVSGGSGNYTYSWNNGQTGSTATGLAAGSYQYQITDGANCVITGAVTITEPDSLVVLVEGTDLICEGATNGWANAIAAGATAPYNYSWSNGVTDSVNTTLPYGVYAVTLTDANGCEDTSSMVISEIVNQMSISATEVCVNEPVAFEGTTNVDSAIISWQWNLGDGTTSSDQLTYHAYTTPGIKQVSLIITSSTGCIDSLGGQVLVNDLPVAEAGPGQVICAGSSATLSASGGVDYQWLPADSVDKPGDAVTDVTPHIDQWYTIQVTDTNGCVNTDSVQVLVKPLPVPALRPDTMLCYGDTLALYVQGGVSYQWYGNTASLSCPSCPLSAAYPVQDEIYTVKVTNAAGCEAWDTVAVDVLPLPGGISASTLSLCQYENVTLSGTVGNGYQYQWTPANLVNDPDAQMTEVDRLDSTTVFHLLTTDMFGCKLLDSAKVEVNLVPESLVSDTLQICLGDSARITPAHSVSGSWWSGPMGTMSCNTCPEPLVYPTQNAYYTINSFTPEGCGVADTILVQVNQLPAPNLGNTSSFCTGAEVTIPATDYPGATYQWSPAAGLNDPTIAQPTATLTNDQVYYVTITDSNGCMAGDSMVYLLRDSMPQSLLADTAACSGELIELDADALFPLSGNGSVTWFNNEGEEISTQNSIDVLASIPQTYLAVVSSEGCAPDTAIMRVGVHELPEVSVDIMNYALQNDSIELTASSNIGNYFEWSDGSEGCIGCSSILVQALEGASYTVTVTDSYGCKASATTRITTFCDAEIYIPNSFSPNSDRKNDVFRVRSVDDIEILTFRIFDRWGNMVFEGSEGANEWNGTYRNGMSVIGVYVYYLEVRCPGGETTFIKGNVTLL